MKVLFCGDRNWGDHWMIRDALQHLREAYPGRDELEICHGDARGADRIAGTEAKALGIPVTEYPADWERHGKSAGPIRNRLMVKYFAPDTVYAFHDDLEHSKGTKDMVAYARAHRIPVRIFVHVGGVDAETQPKERTE